MKKSHIWFCYFLGSCWKRWGGQGNGSGACWQGRDQTERKRRKRKNVAPTCVCWMASQAQQKQKIQPHQFQQQQPPRRKEGGVSGDHQLLGNSILQNLVSLLLQSQCKMIKMLRMIKGSMILIPMDCQQDVLKRLQPLKFNRCFGPTWYVTSEAVWFSVFVWFFLYRLQNTRNKVKTKKKMKIGNIFSNQTG